MNPLISRGMMTILAIGWLGWAVPCQGQLIQTTTPQQRLGNNFFENNSLQWFLRGDGWFANFGGAPVQPPFAPPGAAGSGLSGGLGLFGGGTSGGLRFNFAQGSQQTITSSAPSVTTLDGAAGSFQANTIRPFVTGITPIVADYPQLPNHSEVVRQVGSSQLSALRQSQAALKSKKLDEYLRRAEMAESEGNKRMARANYRGAIALAPEPLRTQIQLHLREVMKRKSK